MRKVILDEFEKEKVYVKDLNDDNIVGILWDDKQKTTYFELDGRYIEICNEYKKSIVMSKSIQEYIKGACSISEVYVFDTIKELFKWMSE